MGKLFNNVNVNNWLYRNLYYDLILFLLFYLRFLHQRGDMGQYMGGKQTFLWVNIDFDFLLYIILCYLFIFHTYRYIPNRFQVAVRRQENASPGA